MIEERAHLDFILCFDGRHASPTCILLVSHSPKWLPTPELGSPALAAHRLVAARKLYGLPLSYIIWSLALMTVILGFGDAQFLVLVFMAFVGAQLSKDPMTQVLGP